MTEPCEFLEWDSAFFDRRIARVTSRRLTPPLVTDILEWSARRQIDCLYFLADVSHPATLVLAPHHGFDLVDVRVVLEAPTSTPLPVRQDSAVAARPAAADDVPALARIARSSHHDSRFYADGRFPRNRCDDFYATWIQESCTGWADAVIVTGDRGEAGGYITAHLTAPGCGKIGLLGVDASRRGRGFGVALVRSVFDWFRDRGISRVSVVTQGRNRDAIAFYERCGFRVAGIDLWYHRWSLEPPEA